jgi:hypothetical protein
MLALAENALFGRFAMLDLAHLRARTPAQRDAERFQRLVEEIAADRARRRELAEKTAGLVLTLDAQLRYTSAGGAVVHLRGWDARARNLSATWRPPEDFDRHRLLEIFHRLRKGTALRLDGFWRARDIRGAKRVDAWAAGRFRSRAGRKPIAERRTSVAQAEIPAAKEMPRK